MDRLPINSFDAVVCVLAIVAVIAGFRSGLLRSVATILGYVAAMPFALALAPRVATGLDARMPMAADRAWMTFLAIFVVAGLLLSALLRVAVSETVGEHVSIPDRLAGSVLGAVRIALLAVLMVVIFDRIIPSGREPPFLAGSRLRPLLSMAEAQGLKTLPPDVADYIDRLKRERGI
jgi:membrane protein required for colicin V production